MNLRRDRLLACGCARFNSIPIIVQILKSNISSSSSIIMFLVFPGLRVLMEITKRRYVSYGNKYVIIKISVYNNVRM